MLRLYVTPVPEQTTDDATDQIGSQVRQAGLLDTGGTNVENVATENVDFRKRGRIQLGPTLSRKLAEELDSLSESAYTTLPLFDAAGGVQARKRGYYEVARIDVTPAQESRDDVYQYDVNLTLAGTREDDRRAVATNPQTVGTQLATGSPAPIGIPAVARNVRWYDEPTGTEPASPTATVTAEFGDVDQYQPEDATADAPTLVYDLPFEADGPTDVRVYDDRDRAKFVDTVSGGQANVWTHVFHPGYQFDGSPVIDSGRLRVRFDVAGGVVTAETYDTGTDSWDAVGLTMGDYELVDYSFERLQPTGAKALVTLRDTTDGSTSRTRMTLRRGRDEVLLQPLPGESLATAATVVFDGIDSTQTTDPQPAQDLIPRSEL